MVKLQREKKILQETPQERHMSPDPCLCYLPQDQESHLATVSTKRIKLYKTSLGPTSK